MQLPVRAAIWCGMRLLRRWCMGGVGEDVEEEAGMELRKLSLHLRAGKARAHGLLTTSQLEERTG